MAATRTHGLPATLGGLRSRLQLLRPRPPLFNARGVHTNGSSCSEKAEFPAAEPAMYVNDAAKELGVTGYYCNRNPRSLELLGMAKKPKGFETAHRRVDYYHRCACVLLLRGLLLQYCYLLSTVHCQTHVCPFIAPLGCLCQPQQWNQSRGGVHHRTRSGTPPLQDVGRLGSVQCGQNGGSPVQGDGTAASDVGAQGRQEPQESEHFFFSC